MIKITRPAPLPAFTAANGKAVKALAALVAEFATNVDFQNGTKTPAWDSSIWGAAKATYIAAQFGKCVFCESRFTAVAHGDVEHFRPKSGYVAKAGQAMKQPGYWWLAYEWNNYWASCQICNQTHKKNLFPLGVGGKRATKPEDDLRRERASLIDPAIDDPAAHLVFRREEVFARNNSGRGTATIAVAGLDRATLNEERRNVWQKIMTLVEFRRELLPSQTDLKNRMGDHIRQTMRVDAPFSAMARDLIAVEAPELLAP